MPSNINLLIQKNAKDFLKNKELFCMLLLELHERKLTTHDGFAVRVARLVYVDNGVALISHNHSDDRCEIMITESPDIAIKQGDQDAGSHGDPKPTAGRGELIKVWENGAKVKDGPWFDSVENVIGAALFELKECLKPVEEEKVDDETHLAAKSEEELRDAWGKKGD